MNIRVCCCVFTSVLTLAGVAAADAPPSKYSAAELQARLGELNARIEGFHIVYEANTQEDPAEGTKISTHREVAAYAPSYFFHFSAKKTPGWGAVQDPLQQRLIVNGDVAIIEHPADRAFIRSPVAGKLPGSAPRELLFLALAWWPLQELKTPQLVSGTSVVLSDLATSRDYRVWPRQSRVGDRWCHVLEHVNHDRLWLDTARGCMIMAREIFEPQSGELVQRIEATEAVEVSPGVWAPKTFRNMLFERQRQRVIADSQIVIRQISVNGPRSSQLFEFRPKPGSIQLKNGGYAQAEVGGLDYLDETALRLKQFGRYRDLEAVSAVNVRVITAMTIALTIAFGAMMTIRAMWDPSGVLSKLRRPVG